MPIWVKIRDVNDDLKSYILAAPEHLYKISDATVRASGAKKIGQEV